MDDFNPVGSSKAFANGFFAKIPYPEPGYALVLTGGPSPLVIQGSDIPSKGQLRRGNYTTQTAIDIQIHPVSFEADLLSADSVSRFHVVVSMDARVEYPAEVQQMAIHSVASVAKSAMLPDLEEYSVRHHMEETELTALRNELFRAAQDHALVSGVRLTNIHIVLTPDQSYANNIRKIRDIHDKRKINRALQQSEMEDSQHYSDPVMAIYREVVDGRITPDEANRRLQAKNSENFDETVRKYREMLSLLQDAQNVAGVSPELLESTTTQMFQGMMKGLGPAAVQTQGRLEEQNPNRYAPPDEDEDDDTDDGGQ